MTNKEILAELKKSYEYLYDIRENGCYDHCDEQLDMNSAIRLENAMNEIAEVYDSLRTTMSDEECSLKIKGRYYLIGHTISEDYNIAGEDIYISCADVDYYWYEDVDYLEEESE